MKLEGSNPDDERQARVLAGIEDALKIEQLSARMEAMNDQEVLQDRSAVLPEAVAERISRFETAITGHFNRLLDGLEHYRRLKG
jgi:hypothetical protein